MKTTNTTNETVAQYPTLNLKGTGERIRQLRKEKGITVRELKDYMGFNEPQAIYKWQRGDSLPTLDNMYALAKILDTSIEDILVGDDEMSSFCAKIYMNRLQGCI